MATSKTVTREDLKQILNKVLPTGLTDKSLYHYEEVSLSNGSASTYYGTFDISLPSVEGYKPIAVRKISLNQVNKSIYQLAMSDTTLTVGVSNISLSGTIGTLYIYATIVYIKESVSSDPLASSNIVLLYDNDNNVVATTSVTLSETAANFNMIKICYKTNDGDSASVDVYHPNGKTACLWGALTSGTSIYTKQRVVKIQDATITNLNGGQGYLSGTSVQATWSGDYIAITQVIGYRII